jgi:hypothetical protein
MLSNSRSDRPTLAAVEPLLEAIEAGVFAFAPRGNCLLLAERPRLRLDENRLLHAWDGNAAVQWPGSGYHYWCGVAMTDEAGSDPDALTPSRVLGWANAERRRVAIERFGWDWLLNRFQEVQQDDYGRLYKSRTPIDGETVTVVRVTNATREPDGSRKQYFLRVPPSTRTARQAIAWTFGYTNVTGYEPVTQT